MKNPLIYLIIGWVCFIGLYILSIWITIDKQTMEDLQIIPVAFFVVSTIFSHIKNKYPLTNRLIVGYILILGGYLIGYFIDGNKIIDTISIISMISGFLVVLLKRY